MEYYLKGKGDNTNWNNSSLKSKQDVIKGKDKPEYNIFNGKCKHEFINY